MEPDMQHTTRRTRKAGSNPLPFDATSLYNLTVGFVEEKRGLSLASRIEAELPSLPHTVGPAPWSFQLLMSRYRCSRETLREAIGILDSRGQIEMKSGRNGGIKAKSPQLSKVVLPLANYFCLSGVTIVELCEATEIFRSIVIRLRGHYSGDNISIESDINADKILDGGVAFEAESRCYRNIALDTGNAVTRLTMALMDVLGRYALHTAASAGYNRFGQCAEKGANDGTSTGHSSGPASSKYTSAMNSRLQDYYDLAIRIPVEHAFAQDSTCSDRAAILLANELLRSDIITGSDSDRISFENHIIEHYNVGRRRVRQAIRILEDAGVVKCRPGRGNGLMAAGQSPATLQRRVFGYLAASGFDETQYATYVSALDCIFAREAARRVTPADHAWLQSVIDGMHEDIQNNDPIQSLGRFFSVHDRLIANPLVKMWRKTLCACSSKLFSHNIKIDILDKKRFIEEWIKVTRAIMSGNTDVAERKQLSASKFLLKNWLN